MKMEKQGALDSEEYVGPRYTSFSNKTLAEKIERISVADKSGNIEEIKIIISAIDTRKQKLITGFDYFVGNSSDISILKALEPLIKVISHKDITYLFKTLLKHSKLRLVINSIELCNRFKIFETDDTAITFSYFESLFNNLEIDNFYFAIDFLQQNGIRLIRPERIFVFEKMLFLEDKDVIEIIKELQKRGIEINIKKTQLEIENLGEGETSYRLIAEEDFNRPNWYEGLNDSVIIFSIREFSRAIKESRTSDALLYLQKIAEFRNGIERIFPKIIELVEEGKLPILETQSALFSALDEKSKLTTQNFLGWALFVYEENETLLFDSVKAYGNALSTKTQKPIYYLNRRSLLNFLETTKWRNSEHAIRFMKMTIDLANIYKIPFGYFLMEAPFGRSTEFIESVEGITGVNIDSSLFGLALTYFEENGEPGELEKVIDFGIKRNLFDSFNFARLYKVGLLNLDVGILKYIVDSNLVIQEKRNSLRQTLLSYELSGGNLSLALRLFSISAELKDQDSFDSVVLIQKCSFPDILEVEELIGKYLLAGLPFDEVSVGSLCNRYSRNNQYGEVLRVLDTYKNFYSSEDTVLKIYRLAAFSNLNMVEEAKEELKALLLDKNEYLIKRYAPSILRKIKDPSMASIAQSLNFELKESNKEYRVREIVEISGGIVRDRNLPKEIKSIYDSVCQVCGEILESPFGRISEAAHIQPLGQPHFGSDDLSNLLCLCPNHHKLFDSSGWYLSDALEIFETSSHKEIGVLRVEMGHEISPSSVIYQRNYAINAANRKKRLWNN